MGKLKNERRELGRLEREAGRRKRHAEQVARGLSKRKVDTKDRSTKACRAAWRLAAMKKKLSCNLQWMGPISVSAS